MQQVNELSKMLNQHFNWHKAKMDCLVGMLIALLNTRNVNLTQLAVSFSSEAQINSRYRRIQRLIHGYMDFDKVSLFIMLLFGFTETGFHLVFDRTNWKFGKIHINILMLAIVHQGAAIPIMWIVLNNKRGNSTMQQRIAMMKRFIKLFGKERILGIFGDREFIGGEWFEWLQSEGINYHIRIKQDALITNSKGEVVSAKNLFHDLKPGEQTVFEKARKVTGVWVYIAAMRLNDGSLLIVASKDFCAEAISIYGKRWEIETLFACLKSWGFRFEETHLSKRHRIKTLLVVMAIAFCWAKRTGEWAHKQNPIKIKKHERLAKSIFRLGLDLLQDGLKNLTSTMKSFATQFFQFIEIKAHYSTFDILSCT